MKVPDKEFFEKNKVHLEMLTIKGEWKRLDTFYDYSTAINHGVNKYFAFLYSKSEFFTHPVNLIQSNFIFF